MDTAGDRLPFTPYPLLAYCFPALAGKTGNGYQNAWVNAAAMAPAAVMKTGDASQERAAISLPSVAMPARICSGGTVTKLSRNVLDAGVLA
jgi:hypothetical protein